MKKNCSSKTSQYLKYLMKNRLIFNSKSSKKCIDRKNIFIICEVSYAELCVSILCTVNMSLFCIISQLESDRIQPRAWRYYVIRECLQQSQA
jgi:hypothetical protein